MDLEISRRNGENEMQEEIFFAFCFWVMDGLDWNGMKGFLVLMIHRH
jgi:hypothetical protein